MNASMSRLRIPRRGIVFLLLAALLFSVFALVIPAQAEASSSYKVKHTESDGFHYYTVYKGTYYSYMEPTFYRDKTDIFRNSDTGNDIKITFYWPIGSANKDQAEAFWRYLGNHIKGKSWWCGYVSFNVNDGSGKHTVYYPYSIEGWNCANIKSLLKRNPWYNRDGVALYLENIGEGNLVSSEWSYLRDVLGCSWGVYYPVSNPRAGATVGFRFEDYYGNPLYLYCP